jgi:hypothetical protein
VRQGYRRERNRGDMKRDLESSGERELEETRREKEIQVGERQKETGE